jgi:predicted alpha/beta hydrolase family esterase
MSATTHRYLILHGIDGSSGSHWQNWLAHRLGEQGHEVCFPDFPNPGKPNLDEWDELLDRELAQGVDTTLVAHSLGAYLWLRHASGRCAFPVRRALLVAPPGKKVVETSNRIDAGSPFRFDALGIRRAAGEILLVGSTADPFCPAGFQNEYAIPLNLSYMETPAHTGHLNIESGFGPWEFALEWALRSNRPSAKACLK